MSLDVYLNLPRPAELAVSVCGQIYIRENGSVKRITEKEWAERSGGRLPATLPDCESSDEVYTANITHNLTRMAKEAGLYECLWRPDENNMTHARDLVEPMFEGLEKLRSDPERFRAMNPENGWGSYDDFVPWVEEYLNACVTWQSAEVRVWR